MTTISQSKTVEVYSGVEAARRKINKDFDKKQFKAIFALICKQNKAHYEMSKNAKFNGSCK